MVAAAVAAFALWLFHERLHGLSFQWDLFVATFVQLSWGWVAASAILALLTYAGRALRWAVMLRPLRPDPSFWGLVSATAIGFTAIVLFGRPGEFVRPYLISVKERVPLSSQLAAWLLERIYDLLAVLAIFGFALSRIQASGIQLGPGLEFVLKVGGHTVGITATVAILILILARYFSEAMRRRLMDSLNFLPARYHQRVEKLVSAFIDGAAATRSAAALAQIILYTVLEWILIVGSYLCLFRAFPVAAHLGLTDVLIFIGFVSFGSILQIPAVGGGVQLASAVVLVELFGFSLEVATGLALLVWVITFVVIVPLGLALAFHEGIKLRRIKELQDESVLA